MWLRVRILNSLVFSFRTTVRATRVSLRDASQVFWASLRITGVLQAATEQRVNLGWVVYNAAEALPNLLNPFSMLRPLGLLRIRSRVLVGYPVLQMFMHVPLVFFLCWLFAQYIPFVPPMK